MPKGIHSFPPLAADLVARDVTIIVTGGSEATRAAQRATKTIPIVMAVSAAPVRQGFVESLARRAGTSRA
jgi:putative ABC transport system substrate-binding protein